MENRRGDLLIMIAGTAALIGFWVFRRQLENFAKWKAKELIASEGGLSREAADQLIGE